nr:phosphoribosylglycinamide formyltransferase [Thalassobacillus sp. CUG 92003]
MKQLAVFASGTGSNFDAIMQAKQAGTLDAKVELVVCDRPGAPVIAKAEQAGVPVLVLRPKDFDGKALYEEHVLSACRAHDIDGIILAGYMRLIGPTLLASYQQRILNIHPSLLPAFPGKDAVGQALDKGVKMTGVTVHYVDDGMDTGPIIAQEAVPVADDDTKESLQAKIQAVEHRLYPEVIQSLSMKEESL